MRTIVVVVATSLLTTTVASAHHSFSAEFDLDKPIRLTGVVTKLEWTNPHAWFYIDVKDDSGKVTNWGWELGSPNGLLRTGWTRNSLKVGTEVTVEGSRARDGGNTANARDVIITSTGQKLFAASSQPAER
jgi:hypothetical protein